MSVTSFAENTRENARGEVRFGDGDTATRELRTRRFVVARVEGARLRASSLRLAIDEAVETALASRGALPPAIGTDAPIESACADQIFRAKALGATGLAIVIPPLERGETIDGEDSATLLAWTASARATSVVLAFDQEDDKTKLLAPIALRDLAPAKTTSERAVEVEIEPDSISPDVEIEITPPPPAASMDGKPLPPIEASALEEIASEPPKRMNETRGRMIRRPMMSPRQRMAELLDAEEPKHEAAPIAMNAPEVATSMPSVEAARVVDAAEWRAHAIELDRARGPKPVATIEKLFGASYLPLLGAIARNEVDATVRGVVDAWRTTFEHSYRESFAALRVTAKRPPMVFDAPEIAGRIARQNGARKVVPVMVDAMRFDVAERVSEKLAVLVAGRAVRVDRSLLWAALPTNTATQMHLIARGADALREGDLPREGEPEIARGRAVAILRRERLGSRDVLKLDLVEARLRGIGPAYDERLDSIAAEVADVIARFIESCPPRTLVYLFGDHGFKLTSLPDGRATGPASQGGASPEEVLLAGHAWLVGEVH